MATTLGAAFDELYKHDGIQRLKDMVRGKLNSAHTALTSETFGQCWTLDSTGNWQGMRQDDNGDGTWDLIQARTSNKVNEITGISQTAGPAWVAPVYSPAGNMTWAPKSTLQFGTRFLPGGAVRSRLGNCSPFHVQKSEVS